MKDLFSNLMEFSNIKTHASFDRSLDIFVCRLIKCAVVLIEFDRSFETLVLVLSFHYMCFQSVLQVYKNHSFGLQRSSSILDLYTKHDVSRYKTPKQINLFCFRKLQETLLISCRQSF